MRPRGVSQSPVLVLEEQDPSVLFSEDCFLGNLEMNLVLLTTAFSGFP